MQWFKRDNSASASFLVSAAVWLVIGTLMGLVLTIEFVFPDFAKGIPWLVFGASATGPREHGAVRVAVRAR